MKKKLKKLKLMIVVCAVTLSMLACGGLVSVPKLTDADNDQIVNIGDSIFALSGDIYEKLHSYAGETWRHYAISGARMIGGGFVAKPIPRQYHEAKKDDSNIRVVYMDGGANDILSPSLLFDPYKCKGSISQDCKDLIDDVYVETVNLLNEMDRDGVQQVIFLGYYYIKKGLYGDLSVLNDSVDHGDKRLADACRNSTVNCEFVDPRSSFLDDYIILDGIHPNKEGSDVLADLIWDVIDVEGSS